MDTERAETVLMGQPVRWLERWFVAQVATDQVSRDDAMKGSSRLCARGSLLTS